MIVLMVMLILAVVVFGLVDIIVDDNTELRIILTAVIVFLSFLVGALVESSSINSQTEVIKKYQKGDYTLRIEVNGDQVDTLYKVR